MILAGDNDAIANATAEAANEIANRGGKAPQQQRAVNEVRLVLDRSHHCNILASASWDAQPRPVTALHPSSSGATCCHPRVS